MNVKRVVARAGFILVVFGVVIGGGEILSSPSLDSDSDYSRAALRIVLTQTEDTDLVRRDEKLEAFRKWSDGLQDRKLAAYYNHWIDVIERTGEDAGGEALRDARVRQLAEGMPRPNNP